MTTTYGLSLVGIFTLASLSYVYKWRGQARFETLSEYLRKGWPIFAPLNCLLYIFTKPYARKAVMNLEDFPELAPIKENWATIRDEVMNLYNQKYFDTTKKDGSAAYYDIGFRTFYKYGWSKFYIRWYGHSLKSAQELCPKTVALLEKIPTVNGAMFSMLPGGSKLTRHLDPIACSLRYHMGLSTPNNDNCYLNVDGQDLSWRDGEAFIFDETYLHYAFNNSDQPRVILMCDIDRPTHTLGAFINFLYKGLAKLTVVPNVEGDKRGFANRVFSGLSPILKKTKALKATNKPMYLVVKYSVNLLLLLVIVAVLGAIFSMF
jgi:beta-hydroxylase